MPALTGVRVERSGIHRVLERDGIYRAVQRIVGGGLAEAGAWPDLYPELGAPGTRVLDIGCGPAAFYARSQPMAVPFAYVGIEPNRDYVARARTRFSDIDIYCGTVRDVGSDVQGVFNLIVLEGVLHHIDDDSATEALNFARERLAPGGRVVTLDPVLVEGQHPVARALARLDRGRNVRTLIGYRDLVGTVFEQDRIQVRHLTGRLRVPYDHALVEAR